MRTLTLSLVVHTDGCGGDARVGTFYWHTVARYNTVTRIELSSL